MINYILKNGAEINKPFELETQLSLGSFGLRNNFIAVGGKKDKISYYSFYDQRNGNGWRANSEFYTKAGFGTITYQLNPALSISFELMQSNIRSQQPGGLTDLQIEENPRQSNRSRNWMDITWTTPALMVNYQVNKDTRWNTKLYGTIGDRNSVGFLQSLNNKDSIIPSTSQYQNRLVNLDQYRNYGLESRVITNYSLWNLNHTLSAGIRLYTGSTKRLADGKGSTNTNYDITIEGQFPKDIQFTSHNMAGFVENIFRISNQFYIIPGIRYEWLEGTAAGKNGVINGNEISLQNITRSRSFVLTGLGSEYHLNDQSELYANISQAYRPIQFANLQAPPTTDLVDPNLKDARGYNVDFGFRGKLRSYLQYDMSVFYLQYNNRVGTIINSNNSRLITNVGASTSKGFEGYVEFNPIRAFTNSHSLDCILFASYAYTDATYSSNHMDASTKGKRVENAPRDIFRGGISFGVSQCLLTLQMSSVSACYSDANNTVTPSSNSNTGLIPAYSVADATAAYKISKKIQVKAGLNNIFNANYFTRRAGGYPGPGALPADGRNYFLNIGIKL
jgi:Fe(3+) dicitrate transport protein